jgi:hypothetical protein
VRRPLVSFALSAVLIGSLTACTSPWQSAFEPASDAAYPPSERVVIREIPWERVASALGEIDAQRAASDVHPDEWPAEKLEAEKARLVEALQLSEDPGSLEILGRSDFNSTADVQILDGSLSSFARSIGADYALWSSAFMGTAEAIEREPVTRSGYTWRRHRRRDGHVDYDYLPYNETVYVPVVVERDRFAWVVFYVRVTD